MPTDWADDQSAEVSLDIDLNTEVDIAGDVDVDEGTTPASYRVVFARFSWPQGFSENGDGYRIRTNSFGFMATAQSAAENDQYRLRAVHFGN